MVMLRVADVDVMSNVYVAAGQPEPAVPQLVRVKVPTSSPRADPVNTSIAAATRPNVTKVLFFTSPLRIVRLEFCYPRHAHSGVPAHRAVHFDGHVVYALSSPLNCRISFIQPARPLFFCVCNSVESGNSACEHRLSASYSCIQCFVEGGSHVRAARLHGESTPPSDVPSTYLDVDSCTRSLRAKRGAISGRPRSEGHSKLIAQLRGLVDHRFAFSPTFESAALDGATREWSELVCFAERARSPRPGEIR